jgi:hypothetical protein
VAGACAIAIVATAIAAGAGAATAPAASAGVAPPSFTAPVDLAAAGYGLDAATATDAAGATAAIVTGDGAPKLLERPVGAAWPAPTRLPGDPRGMKGPVLAAAGQGALAIAWRVDLPRRYAGIQAALRDPGGALSTPIVVADDSANGVRHPALAVDPAGDTLLAYNADTRKSHLSMRGAIAVAYRPAHGSFATSVVVDDAPSQPPAVALAPDGTGIVAWVHSAHIYAVSIAQGDIGKVKAVASAKGIDDLAVAAGPRGEATIAWSGSGDSRRRYQVRALRRLAHRSFGHVRVVATTKDYVSEVALAADETGRTTVAWPEDDYDSKTGPNGITTSVHTATAAPGHGFGAPHTVTAKGTRYRQSLSLAAVNGRVALAWGYKRDSRHLGVQATVGSPTALPPPQTVASAALTGNFYLTPPTAHVTLGPTGAATVLAVLPAQPDPKSIASRLIATDGG